MRAIVDANVIRTALATRFEPHELKRFRLGSFEQTDIVLRRTHAPRIKSLREAQEINYVPAILEAHKSGAIELVSTSLIEHEKHSQKHLRGDRSNDVFDIPSLKILNDPSFSQSWAAGSRPLRASIHPPPHLADLYAKILKCIGENKRADASHVLTAETQSITYILTMDIAFLNAARNLAKVGVPIIVMSPKQLAEIAGIPPWSDDQVRAQIEQVSFFVNQRIVPLAVRQRRGPLGLLASRYRGVGDYSKLSHGELKDAIKLLQRQVFWRAFFRAMGPQALWTFGDPEKLRLLNKRLAEPIPLN